MKLVDWEVNEHNEHLSKPNKMGGNQRWIYCSPFFFFLNRSIYSDCRNFMIGRKSSNEWGKGNEGKIQCEEKITWISGKSTRQTKNGIEIRANDVIVSIHRNLNAIHTVRDWYVCIVDFDFLWTRSLSGRCFGGCWVL